MEKKKLIVVGAGIAGLIIARELARVYQVTVIEAEPVPGGRIQSVASSEGAFIIEGGAEFIHGNLKHTMDLLQEAGISYVPIKGKTYRLKKGKIVEQKEMITGWDEFLAKMAAVEKDMTLQRFLDEQMPGEPDADIRRQAIQYAEGFDLADVNLVSVRSLQREWSAEEQDIFRIPAGYGALVRYLADQATSAGVTFMFGQAVNQVHWVKGRVEVYTESGNCLQGSKAVVTTPVSILQADKGRCAISMEPALDEHRQAVAGLRMGAVIKFVFEFDEGFWPKDGLFFISNEPVPTWWPQNEEQPILTGWVGGTKALLLSAESDTALVDKALRSLAVIFSKQEATLREKLRGAHVFNWQRKEGSQGGYSYDTPWSVAARKVLHEPVEETIYFSGEGLYEGDSPGTVEAAIIQAKQTAIRLVADAV